jgi:outer membrane protein TolC
MKRLFFIIAGVACCLSAQGQFTLEDCQELARENYPLIKQHGLIEQTTDYSVANAMKAYLPQVSFSAQASYQSDVAAFPQQMLNMYEQIGLNMKGLNKDQYRAALEVNQTVWDGGLTRARVESLKAESNVSAQSIETELYNVRERINRLYFGILILDEQLRQNKVLQELLQSNYRTVDACVKNGIATPGDLHAIKAEQLTVSQQYIQVESVAIAYRNMLSVMIGREIDESATFKKPVAMLSHGGLVNQLNNRPEWRLFEAQTEQFEAQKRSVIASTMPRLGLFAQGFYGNPGLNLFKDMTEGRWTWNYIAGIRLQWNFGNF